ncbi:MAG: hypothetical protein MJZ34_16870, partial [Paludibacteraceae bacterium]|nr:hypothetical protein [Paludibacteraceae bacterium]
QCKNNILKHIQTSKNSISNQFRREFEEMFSVLEDDGCSYIDAGYTGDKLKVEIERDQKRLMSIVEGNLEVIVHNEMIDLRDKVENEVHSLQEYAKIDKVSDSFSAQFQLSIGNVIRELNLGVGDIVNWAGYLGACFGLGWAIAAGANWWNPVGWILTAVGFGFGIFGDSKQSKAKSKFRESLTEAKSQFYRNNFPNLCGKVDDALDSKSEEITKKIDSIITDFKKLANQINNIKVSIKRNSIQYK